MSETSLSARVFDAISREDMATFFSLLHDDIELVEPASLPVGGLHVGHEAVLKNVFKPMGRKFQVRVLRSNIIGTGPVFAASADVQFTARATGNVLVMPYVELHTARGDKLSRLEVYPQDTAALMAFWNAN